TWACACHSFGKELRMRYILAIFLPPFALLRCGKTGQLVVNLVFWMVSLCFWLLGLITIFLLPIFGGIGFAIWLACTLHAVIVCARLDRSRQVDRLVEAIQSRPAPAAVPPVQQHAN